MSIGLVDGIGPVVDGGTTILPGTSGIMPVAWPGVGGAGGHPGCERGAGARSSVDVMHGGVSSMNRDAVSKLFSRMGTILAHPQRPIARTQGTSMARRERGFVAAARSW